MTALTDFLLARIAEDEAIARKALQDDRVQTDAEAWWCDEQESHVGIGPARMLAECEAKRRIVRDRLLTMDSHDRQSVSYAGERILRALALPYADHADYREEWKP